MKVLKLSVRVFENARDDGLAMNSPCVSRKKAGRYAGGGPEY
jgi:hypothetical protein